MARRGAGQVRTQSENLLNPDQPPQKPQGSPVGVARETCGKCGGRVVPARVQEKDGNVVLRPMRPDLLDFRFTALTAYTCITCGFTEFYAQEPDQL